MSTSNPYAPPQADVRDVPVEGLELAGRGMPLLGLHPGRRHRVPHDLSAGIDRHGGDRAARSSRRRASTSRLRASPGCCASSGSSPGSGSRRCSWRATARRSASAARDQGRAQRRLARPRSAASSGCATSSTALLGVIPLYALVDLLFIFGERRQCIHDLIADTIVVRA